MTSRDPHSRRYVLVGVVASAILIASLLDTTPAPAGTASDGFPTVAGVGLDKWLHALGYAIFAGVLAAAWRYSRGVAFALGAVGAIGFGVGVELLQLPLSTRTASVADALANAAGALVGASVWYRFAG